MATRAMSTTSRYCYAETPLGTVLLTGDGDDDGLTGVYFTGHRYSPRSSASWEQDGAGFVEVRSQLEEYFDGQRTQFDLALALYGSELERTVWAALCEIPYGETVSYSHIARRIGRSG